MPVVSNFSPVRPSAEAPIPFANWQQLFLHLSNVNASAQTSAGGTRSEYSDGGFMVAGRAHGATANTFLGAFPLHQPPPARLEGLPSPTSVVRNFEVWGTRAPGSCFNLQHIKVWQSNRGMEAPEINFFCIGPSCVSHRA